MIRGYNRPPGVEREENDYYATCPTAIPPLLSLLGWQAGGKVIRENSCGAGHLCRPLEAAGHTVIASDLIDRGYGITGIDFLIPSWLDDLRYDAVIMNPPYKFSFQFVQKSLTLAPIVCSFLRLSWLESQTRRKFFEEYPPHTVAVFTNRIASAKNGDFDKAGSNALCYAWFIWRAGFKGDPIIKWI